MVNVPHYDNIYGFMINTAIYGKESIDFYNKQGFVCGSLNHRDPVSIYRKILETLVSKIGQDEWNQRNRDMLENKRRLNDTKT